MVILFEYLVVGQWLGLQIISYVFKGIIQIKNSFFSNWTQIEFLSEYLYNFYFELLRNGYLPVEQKAKLLQNSLLQYGSSFTYLFLDFPFYNSCYKLDSKGFHS